MQVVDFRLQSSVFGFHFFYAGFVLVSNIVVVYTSVGYCGGKETCGLDAHDVCRLGLAATLVEDDVELVVLGGDGEFLIVPFLAARTIIFIVSLINVSNYSKITNDRNLF